MAFSILAQTYWRLCMLSNQQGFALIAIILTSAMILLGIFVVEFGRL
jgi:hypothetical protein